jgi:putative endonuclease
MITTKQRGDHAEQQALQYLQSFGMSLIQQNFHSRRGEIDLIMSDQDCLVFIEVRYRKTDKYGSAVESVDSRKQSRIIHAAQSYIQKNITPYRNYRFDVIAITPEYDKNSLVWIKDAFQLN